MRFLLLVSRYMGCSEAFCGLQVITVAMLPSVGGVAFITPTCGSAVGPIAVAFLLEFFWGCNAR